MLPADENLWHGCLVAAEPFLQFSVKELVHVDVPLLHRDTEVVKKRQRKLAFLKGGSQPSKTGRVHHDLPLFLVSLDGDGVLG